MGVDKLVPTYWCTIKSIRNEEVCRITQMLVKKLSRGNLSLILFVHMSKSLSCKRPSTFKLKLGKAKPNIKAQ